jgi:hypothetical protein
MKYISYLFSDAEWTGARLLVANVLHECLWALLCQLKDRVADIIEEDGCRQCVQTEDTTKENKQ